MKTPKHSATVTRLAISDFMRVRAIDITPDSVGLVELHGRNAQGKSSVLRAMWSALGGKGESPSKPVREGADRATARVELGDLVVERQWRPDGNSRLEVSSQDGALYKRPQQILDALVSRIAFDPVAFLRYDAKRQAEILRDVAGIDTREAEGQVERAFERRREQNAVVRTLEGRLPEEPPSPDRVDTSELDRELEQIAAWHSDRRKAEAAHESARQSIERHEERIADLDAEIKALQDKRAELAKKHAEASEQFASATRILDAATQAGVKIADEDNVRARLDAAHGANAAADRHDAWKAQAADLEAERAKQADLTADLESRREDLAELVRSAAYPVEGLGVTSDGVRFHGMPLEQASQAEQLRVSMAMAIATHPELKVVHVKEGSLLDSDSLELVRAMAVEHGFQVWVEVVDDADGGHLVIEDGAVRTSTEAEDPQS